MRSLDPIERDARRLQYPHLVARIRWTRAYLLNEQKRYVESLAEYDAAFADFARLGDRESLAAIHSRRSGIFRTIGQPELAWRESFQALHDVDHIVELQPRHVLLGETA